MSAVAIKNLPPIYKEAIINVFNVIVAYKYWPVIFRSLKMIFIHKKGNDSTDPLNDRPICLIEIMTKVLEKTLTSR